MLQRLVVSRLAILTMRPSLSDRWGTCCHGHKIMRRQSSANRPAFSLVEAMIAIAIMAIVGGAIMVGLASSASTTTFALESAIAEGIARQVVDEVVGNRYAAVGSGPYQVTLGPSAWEEAGSGRERFDDTDDFHDFTAQPVEDLWGSELGQGDDAGGLRHSNFQLPSGYFSTWRQQIEVYYVDNTDQSIRLSSGNTSDFRAVEVAIYADNADGTSRELTRTRRVYAYVPTLQ